MADLRSIARQIAVQYGIDPDIFERQIQQESGFNPDAHNDGSGAHGIAQIVPATGAQPGYGVRPIGDSSDPVDSLRFAAEYMRAMLAQTDGDYGMALSAYNGGLGNVLNGNYNDPNWSGYAENSGYRNTILGGGGGNFMGPDTPDNASGDDGRANIIHSQFVTRNGQVFRIDTYSNGKTNAVPASAGDVSANGGGTNTAGAPTWAQQQNASQHSSSLAEQQRQFNITNARLIAAAQQGDQHAAAQLAEQQRQFNENFGMKKAEFNSQQGLAEATQKWREATDSRDFGAAEFWKSRAYEMQRNNQTMDYTKQLQSMSGPQDYVKYWYASRGMTTPKGAESVPYEQAIPSWAQPVQPGSFSPAGQTAAVPAVVAPAAVAPVAAAPKAAPVWAGNDLTGMIGTPAEANAQIARGALHPADFGSMTLPAGGLTKETSDFFLQQQKLGQITGVPKWAGA